MPIRQNFASFARDPANRALPLLAVAFVFGGGGVAYGLNNLAVQLTALAMLGWSAAPLCAFLRESPRSFAALVLCCLVLPLLQILPLPPGLWTALPGRALVAESLSLIGHEDDWFPMSVNSGRTLVAFLGLVAPFAVLALNAGATPDKLHRLALTIVLAAIACALFGMAQLLSRDSWHFYDETPMPGVLFGTFANRNSTGAFLVCGLALLMTLPREAKTRFSLAWRCAGGLALALGVILTQSRSAVALLAVPAILLVWRAAGWWTGRRQARALRANAGRFPVAALLGLAGACLVIVGAIAAGHGPTRLNDVVARFDQGDGARAEMWEDAVFAARRYWPVGAGMGTFDEVFQIDESLEYVSPRTAGRAHNDYIELAIEAGLPGLALIVLGLAWCVIATVRACRAGERWPACGAGGVVACVALQSLVDYPLRNQAMLCVLAAALAILAGLSRRKAQ